MSEEALAPGGYLEERGLVPLSDTARAELRERVANAVTMDPDRVKAPKASLAARCFTGRLSSPC